MFQGFKVKKKVSHNLAKPLKMDQGTKANEKKLRS